MKKLAFAILCISSGFAGDYYPGDDLVRKGVYAFYNYEYEKADSILTSARKEYPNHPGVHLIWAAARWVKSQAHDSIEETHRVLERDLDEIKPIYESLVDQFPNDQIYQLYQGSALGLSARVTLGKKEWLRTLYRAYRGFSIINEVAENSPENMDAKLPIGIVEYYAGISNSLLKFAVNMYGLNSSTESGLDQITLAADSSDWAWIEAKGILGFLYLWVEDNPIMALMHSKDLVEKFPQNYYFNILYLESTIRTSQYDISHAIIEDMEKRESGLLKRQVDWYIPYLNYEKGLLAFHENRWDDAQHYLNESIDYYTAELDIILGNAHLFLGMIFDANGKRQAAKSQYEACLELDNFSSTMEKANQYLDMPYAHQ